ncbi:uncharacterized protein LOC122455400 [Dermochelys coriacea]|uniref:uncharacterized protein LOC122455400 n=1 Tax=Dermochelys coriacea TaxID=27794 RepID=UPI001CAA219E|nr:uncharacterized protein LOC122455400 [Dermochelys coriacea]
MPALSTRRSSTWSNAELLNLIIVWGVEAVQSQLCCSRRNYDNRQISQCMRERGHDWDTLHCRVKVKELWNAYHRAQETTTSPGAAHKSSRFYNELDAILSGDPPSIAKATVDTSVACMPIENGPSQEKKILDEDVEGDGDPEAEDDSEVRDACSQEFFSTLEKASKSQLSELGKAQTGEEASDMTLGAQPPSLLAAAEQLCRIRKRP